MNSSKPSTNICRRKKTSNRPLTRWYWHTCNQTSTFNQRGEAGSTIHFVRRSLTLSILAFISALPKKNSELQMSNFGFQNKIYPRLNILCIVHMTCSVCLQIYVYMYISNPLFALLWTVCLRFFFYLCASKPQHLPLPQHLQQVPRVPYRHHSTGTNSQSRSFFKQLPQVQR